MKATKNKSHSQREKYVYGWVWHLRATNSILLESRWKFSERIRSINMKMKIVQLLFGNYLKNWNMYVYHLLRKNSRISKIIMKTHFNILNRLFTIGYTFPLMTVYILKQPNTSVNIIVDLNMYSYKFLRIKRNKNVQFQDRSVSRNFSKQSLIGIYT